MSENRHLFMIYQETGRPSRPWHFDQISGPEIPPSESLRREGTHPASPLTLDEDFRPLSLLLSGGKRAATLL